MIYHTLFIAMQSYIFSKNVTANKFLLLKELDEFRVKKMYFRKFGLVFLCSCLKVERWEGITYCTYISFVVVLRYVFQGVLSRLSGRVYFVSFRTFSYLPGKQEYETNLDCFYLLEVFPVVSRVTHWWFSRK